MKNINKKLYISVFFCFIFVLLLFAPTFSTFAEGLVPCGGSGQDACTFADFFVMINNVIDFLIGSFLTSIAALWFGFAGYKMMFSQGDPGKFNEGKNMLLYGCIGFIIIFTAPAIIKELLGLLGASSWVNSFSK
jgi:type IV secretory pathway VirB2 component (pilin)